MPSRICATSGVANRYNRRGPRRSTFRSACCTSRPRCQLAVCGVTPATSASSPAVCARPSISRDRIRARAGIGDQWPARSASSRCDGRHGRLRHVTKTHHACRTGRRRNVSIMIEMFTTSTLRSPANPTAAGRSRQWSQLIAIETKQRRHRWSDRHMRGKRRAYEAFSRRSVISACGAVLAIYLSPWTATSSQAQEQGAKTMNHYATQKSISDAVDGGGLLVVAQWEAKPGEADKVAAHPRPLPARGAARGRRQAVPDLARPRTIRRNSCSTNCSATKPPSRRIRKRAFQDLYRGPGAAAAGEARAHAIHADVGRGLRAAVQTGPRRRATR